MTLTEGSPRYATSKCRSCDAAIIWTTTVANQKKMPVDAEPVEGGNVVLTSGPESRTLTKDETATRQARGERLYVSHYTTCPDRKDWRKSK